ncbi:hypothetical protein D9757_010018 [Collybiopsis confluens]|uniref:alanine--glyoxylate transaminase n=1 Tax=Collybiopsis confluens TaxID=2823264 RepID=A0A8H5GQV8_9AGAR|nr:hypothetical protein D9757_010018 [Collybiopsis confluens]
MSSWCKQIPSLPLIPPHQVPSIPGPIEVSDEVRFYINTVVDTAEGQPFLIAGSGTLGWDQTAANLVEPGENALVLHSGYFGDSFTDWYDNYVPSLVPALMIFSSLETYGANVDQLKAKIGAAVSQEDIESALKSKKYKLLTFTHVDTSTAVLSNAKAIAETIALDGVCSVASEEIHMDTWDIDIILSASQKGLGTPPGLSILVASKRAMQVCTLTSSFPKLNLTPIGPGIQFQENPCNLVLRWLPIMKAYESGNAAYFATPPVNLIYAFHASLSKITKSAPSLADRYKLHREASQRVKEAATELGLKQLPLQPAFAANGMTALYYPEGLSAGDILPRLAKKGIVVAGGLHTEIKDKYFRIGHMGITAVEESRGDVDTVIKALKETLAEARATATYPSQQLARDQNNLNQFTNTVSARARL